MDKVKLVEVGPRDGLQNEKTVLSTAIRSQFIHDLAQAGLSTIEIGSFVSPKYLPQMANTAEVLTLCSDLSCDLPTLVPNEIGFEHAKAAHCKSIAVFAACTESFSQKNIRCSLTESLDNFKNIVKNAKQLGMRVRGYLSCVLGCPYEGQVNTKVVIDMAKKLFAMGCDEISLGDTIGVGTPKSAANLVHAIAQDIPVERLAVHFHDTYGQALANVYASLEAGIRIIDASCAGLGGCPYARGASGNVATEEVIYMLNGLGVQTGVSLPAVIQAGKKICAQLGIQTRSKVAQAYKE
jgi:hydroxymethylglutaryl-CoA lyase